MISKERVEKILVDGLFFDIESNIKVEIEVREEISMGDMKIYVDTKELDTYMRLNNIPFGVMIIYTNISAYANSTNSWGYGCIRL